MKLQRNFPYIDFGITKIHDQLDRIVSELELLRAESRRKQDILSAQDSIALHETAEYVRNQMSAVDSVTSNFELLSLALDNSDLRGDKLVCEFGVWSGSTINHIASHMPGKVYGFDSFEGLPERWRDGFPRSTFKTSELPRVHDNVELVRGWFEETLPSFLAAHPQDAAFFISTAISIPRPRQSWKRFRHAFALGASSSSMNISITPVGEKVNTRPSKNTFILEALSIAIWVSIETMSKWRS